MSEKKVLKFEQPADFFYRSAQKMMDGGSFINALSTIRRAVEIEPDNYEFSLCFAEVLTELARYEESNGVLFELIEKKEELDADCYFCLGCNFMGLNDIHKARESFEKYLALSPDGEYSEEVEDFLYYFDTEEENIREFMDQLNGDGVYDKAHEGKKHLDRAEFEKAVEVLESIEDESDDMAYAKNNLALAYYCLKNVDRAIEVTEKVLKKQANNLHANCNMAIFIRSKEGIDAAEQYIKKVLAYDTQTIEDIYKVGITLCELKKHEEAIPYLRELAEYSPYDEKVLYYLAAALHNTDRPKEAINLLDSIKKLDHPGVIAEYYIKRINNEVQGHDEFVEMDYVYQVPANEAKKKIKYLNDCLKLPDSSFRGMWKEDREFLHTALWGLEYGDDNIKRAIAGMVAGFADQKAEKVLRAFLLKKDQPDDVKNDIFVLLKRMNAAEPYVSYIKGEVVEVKVGTYDEDGNELTEDYAKLFRVLYDVINKHYDEGLIKSALNVIQEYLEDDTNALVPELVDEIAAAILYVALKRTGKEEDMKKICGYFNAEEQIVVDYVYFMRDHV